jgi:hypothetical protein
LLPVWRNAFAFNPHYDSIATIDEIISERCDDDWVLDQLRLVVVFDLERTRDENNERVDAKWLSIKELLRILSKTHRRITYGEDENIFSAESDIRFKLTDALDIIDVDYSLFRISSYFNAELFRDR